MSGKIGRREEKLVKCIRYQLNMNKEHRLKLIFWFLSYPKLEVLVNNINDDGEFQHLN